MIGEFRNGDLFAHFGISLNNDLEEGLEAPVQSSVAPLRKVRPCHACQWLRALPTVGACPNCGHPPQEAKA